MTQDAIREVIERRMAELGITWYSLAQQSGLNVNGSYRVKSGRISYTLRTLRKILPTLGLEFAIKPKDGDHGKPG